MIINLEFSMLGPRLTEEQEDVFHQFAQWVVVNERNGRLLVDGIGEANDVATAMQLLADRDPVVISAWQFGGLPVDQHPVNEAAWLDVAPDDLDYADPENPVAVRPTQYRQVHAWAGWGPRLYSTAGG